ncbi:NupC/NupG family nucleoside CNT transporter [Acetobacter oeni]|uniref:Nucleoside permease n=1 Tax=Acetobacter oeni TaxID=304077 RepID=A0A511XJ66_9PROT|nr:nucleoside transporter C-terminal domain-containing protein [Acetobacter oeni]MBB3882829.1 CNT family concentrative nucleoside transporter [Acetobacter oeni]NHO18917.1 NupC/NupG family nucleoside CNT transporter [Acetobacter oeni]GBR09657.1 nucleoside permease [Acetobacter oeni LMG 21952]GEN62985.1 nucleoside permease [Acetobacter oeni]
MTVLRGLAAILFLVAVGVAFSTNRRAIRPRVVLAALAAQIGIGAVVLFVPPGRVALHAVSAVVGEVLACGAEGTAFLFGPLVGPDMARVFPGGSFVFAFQVLSEIIYVSALIAVLYHFGVMQRLAEGIGSLVQRCLGTSIVESFSAVITIFVGQSEMPVAIAPYLPRMTEAELFAVMCSGTASVTGSVLAGYAALGVPMDYLIAASFMAIPGGLLFARLLMPATEPSLITDMRDLREPADTEIPDGRDGKPHGSANVFEAIATGAAAGTQVAVAVAAILIAFIGLIALLDRVLGVLGHATGFGGLSLAGLLGHAFAPLAWFIGVPWNEAGTIGSIIGQKLAFNEFVAYVNLAPHIRAATLDPHSIAIASFALCGFSNLSSIGILIGAFGSVIPERRGFIARMGARAVLAGSLSNLTSAAIAGLFMA